MMKIVSGILLKPVWGAVYFVQSALYYTGLGSWLPPSWNPWSGGQTSLEEPSQDTTQSSPSTSSIDTVNERRQPKIYGSSYNKQKLWLDLQFQNRQRENGVVRPHEIQIPGAPIAELDEDILDRIKGSIIGMALGDALGAFVEFRPYEFLVEHPVTNLEGGGTWGLEKGQFTDDTSMALCLANSLISCQDFVPYDQLVRYKWWLEFGYMSSTGKCFDIGNATRESINEFTKRQNDFQNQSQTPIANIDDYASNRQLLKDFNVYCSKEGVAGNGALMRLAPVPLFFFRNEKDAIKYSGISGQITHGDKKSTDACRFYGALIAGAMRRLSKDELLNYNFYSNNRSLFGDEDLHDDIKSIAQGSYKTKNGYEGGIRGKGYVVDSLEAALWAFYSTDSFKDGALAAVNLGDDTDTTAAIYGQLAGAFYGYKSLPEEWVPHIYAKDFLEKLSEWIAYEGDRWYKQHITAQ